MSDEVTESVGDEEAEMEAIFSESVQDMFVEVDIPCAVPPYNAREEDATLGRWNRKYGLWWNTAGAADGKSVKKRLLCNWLVWSKNGGPVNVKSNCMVVGWD